MELLGRIFHRNKNKPQEDTAHPFDAHLEKSVILKKPFNPEQFRQELSEMSALKSLEGLYDSALPSMKPEVREQWRNLNMKFAVSILDAIDEDNSDGKKFVTVDSTKKIDGALERITQISQHSKPNRQLEKLFEFTQKHGFQEAATPHYEELRLYVSGFLNIPINGIKLEEFTNGESAKHSPIQFYRYFFQCLSTARSGITIEPLENTAYDKFPNFTRFQMMEEALSVTSVMNLNSGHIQQSFTSLLGQDKQLAATSIKIIERINESRDQILNTVLDGSGEEFQDLKSAIEPDLNGGTETQIFAIFILGLEKKINLIKTYRVAKQHIANDHQAEFYQKLLESMDLLLNYGSNATEIQKVDDLETIFNPNQQTTDEIPTLSQLANITTDIFKKSSKLNYDVEPESISWDKLVPPQNVSVEFDKNKPKKFKIMLKWQNADGEHLQSVFNFDTPKGNFEWSFAEDPQDPQMAEFLKTIKAAANNILLRVKDIAQAAHLEKNQPKNVPLPEITTKKVKVQRQEPVVKTNGSGVTTTKPKVLTPLEQALTESSVNEPAENNFKSVIKIEDQDQFKKLSSKLSHADQAIVTNAIEGYSQGNGSIKRLRAPGPNGEALYSLRISTKVPGGVRVILRESGSAGNIRNFEILAIGYRKDIYRSRLLS